MTDFLSIQFLVYLFRWIMSAFVMFIPLWVLVKFECCKGKYQEYIHLLIVQIIGAFIFFYIDKMIFTN
jgi:hypothetical protein